MKKRKILVTSALPYANGDIHIGHLVEYIQTDIWVRFQQLVGHDCHYICASDTHGTPIMMKAKELNIDPAELVESYRKTHIQDFSEFNINFDYYGSTHSDENRVWSEYIYNKAKEKGFIYTKTIDQLYSETDSMFLPDRFVKGTCPTCEAKDQYGDSCEKCSATYSPMDLIDPYSSVSGDTPVVKQSEHYFFKLSGMEESIKEWVNSADIQSEVKNKLKEWFETGLRDWDISRDDPYFGFKIPGTDNKYFYVWLDAPVGYISSTKLWAKSDDHFKEIWQDGDYEIFHFIGKDILYFHTLFWPAMLSVSDFKQPTCVNVHGFLTVNGQKMSKSRGTFIKARTYLDHLNPEFLRYYYASKLSTHIDDIDLNLEDFVYKTNSDVLGKFINIASRLASIVTKKLDGRLGTVDDDGQSLLTTIKDLSPEIQTCFDKRQFQKATKLIMGAADLVNKYIDTHAPWALVKEDKEKARVVCTVGLNALLKLIIYLKPILPQICSQLESFMNVSNLTYDDLSTTLENHQINKYAHVAQRLELDDVLKIKDVV
jgi:methionyl-tRNA synthetase